MPSPGFQIEAVVAGVAEARSSPAPPARSVVPAAAVERVGAALGEEDIVAVVAGERVVAGAADQVVVAGAAGEAGLGERAVGLVEREFVVAAEPGDVDQGGVCDGGGGPGDRDRAAVDQQLGRPRRARR